MALSLYNTCMCVCISVCVCLVGESVLCTNYHSDAFVCTLWLRVSQPFFIDHVMRATTFIDPRLPVEVPLINPDFLQTPLARGPGRGSRMAATEDAVSP
jgi:hypothetical protein